MLKALQVLVIVFVTFENVEAEFANIRTKCKNQFRHYEVALNNQRDWAMSCKETNL